MVAKIKQTEYFIMKKAKETNLKRKEPKGAKQSKNFSMGMFIVLLILGGIP